MTVVLFLIAFWMAFWAIRARIWRFGFGFTAGVLCLFAAFIPAYLYGSSHDPSLKRVAAACLAGAGMLMMLGWALNSRGSLRSLTVLMGVGATALVVTDLRLVLPPSYWMLTYVLSAMALGLTVVALKYEHLFRRDPSTRE
jgi:glucan phosphoethanolaminetransferase (alkaline phosphatase superfamily)